MADPTFTIDETFFVKDRGLALLSLLDREAAPLVRVLVGDEIELALVGGGCVRTTVVGIELVFDYGRPDQCPLGLLVTLGPDEQQILRGAKAHVVK